MQFSAFAPFGLNPFTAGEPLAKRIYDAIWSNLTGGGRVDNFVKGGYTDAKVYAWSMALARWLTVARRLEAQINPDTVLELLAEREFEVGLVVPAGATLVERRAALRAALAAGQPNTYANLRQALVDLLGAKFVDLRQLPQDWQVSLPTNPTSGPGHWIEPTRPRKLFRLVSSVSSVSTGLGTTFFHRYTRLDGGAVSDAEALQPGESLVLEPEHNVLRERIVVADASKLSGAWTARFTCTQPHHAGALMTTAPWPFWVSTRRHWVVQLTEPASLDAETRRQVHELMAKRVRATTTWSIIGNTTGFLLGVSPLGVTPFEEP